MSTPRTPFVCASCARALRQSTPSSSSAVRSFTTSVPRAQQPVAVNPDEPRWKQTPPAMRMPVRLRPQPNQPTWHVNDKPEPVDEAFDAFIGNSGGRNARGRDLLDEEVKWQTLTHKSFDHGRRPFNDRLALLGRRILELQTSLLLLQQPSLSPSADSDPYIYNHPSLTGLSNLTVPAKTSLVNKERLAQLGKTYGLDKVVRWRPKQSGRMGSSGQDVVLAQTVYAVVGAVALRKGGDVAGRVARERVLGPLGLK